MPAKKRNTVAKKQALSEEDQAVRDKVDLLLKDLEVQTDQMVKDKEREVEAVCKSITTMYKVGHHICPKYFQANIIF